MTAWSFLLMAMVLSYEAHAAEEALPLVCPAGSTLIGDPPPLGKRQWCVVRDASGKLVPHGPMMQWHDNGQPELRGDFRSGKRQGYWFEYDKSGREISRSTFADDILEGPYRGENEAGDRFEGQFHNGERSGLWTVSNRDGKKLAEGPMKGKSREGRWTLWMDDGRYAIGEFIADRREKRWAIYNAARVLIADGNFKSDQKHGVWKEFHETGELHATGTYREDLREGRWSLTYPNGQMEAEGPYLKGMRDGEWKEWDEWLPAADGAPVKWQTPHRWEGTFRGGQKEGVWTRYHPNDQRAATGMMRASRMEGVWTLFDEAGLEVAHGPYSANLRTGRWFERGTDGGHYEGDYVGGVRDGVWAYFGPDGAARAELRFERGVKVEPAPEASAPP